MLEVARDCCSSAPFAVNLQRMGQLRTEQTIPCSLSCDPDRQQLNLLADG